MFTGLPDWVADKESFSESIGQEYENSLDKGDGELRTLCEVPENCVSHLQP